MGKITIGSKMMEKYPDKIPVIVFYRDIDCNVNKYLVPNNTTIGYLLIIIRRNTKLDHSDSLGILVNNIMIPTSETIGNIYTKHRDSTDDCLHIMVTKENTFGKNIFN